MDRKRKGKSTPSTRGGFQGGRGRTSSTPDRASTPGRGGRGRGGRSTSRSGGGATTSSSTPYATPASGDRGQSSSKQSDFQLKFGRGTPSGATSYHTPGNTSAAISARRTPRSSGPSSSTVPAGFPVLSFTPPAAAHKTLAHREIALDKEKEGYIWKVGLPPGKRFSKEWLAAVEKWARAEYAKTHRNKEQSSATPAAPPPPPPPKPAPAAPAATPPPPAAAAAPAAPAAADMGFASFIMGQLNITQAQPEPAAASSQQQLLVGGAQSDGKGSGNFVGAAVAAGSSAAAEEADGTAAADAADEETKAAPVPAADAAEHAAASVSATAADEDDWFEQEARPVVSVLELSRASQPAPPTAPSPPTAAAAAPPAAAAVPPAPAAPAPAPAAPAAPAAASAQPASAGDEDDWFDREAVPVVSVLDRSRASQHSTGPAATLTSPPVAPPAAPPAAPPPAPPVAPPVAPPAPPAAAAADEDDDDHYSFAEASHSDDDEDDNDSFADESSGDNELASADADAASDAGSNHAGDDDDDASDDDDGSYSDDDDDETETEESNSGLDLSDYEGTSEQDESDLPGFDDEMDAHDSPDLGGAAAGGSSSAARASDVVEKKLWQQFYRPVAGDAANRIQQEQSAAAGSGRVQVSLRLEKMGLTDAEAAMLASWVATVADVLEVRKLWMFDNHLGDAGAAACAALLHPGLLELHLSHNFITDDGAKALIAAFPSERRGTKRPLWARLEYNLLHAEQVVALLRQERQARGLLYDVPDVVLAEQQSDGGSSKLRPGSGPCHVRLPWLACQKQAPAEASVLKQVKSLVGQQQQKQQQRQQRSKPRAATPASAATTSTVSSPAGSDCSSGSISSPAPAMLRPPPAAAAGPLLLFPDTSALLSMIGANAGSGSCALTLELLSQAAREGRFGRALPAEEQCYIIIADSVMKQLDGLKTGGYFRNDDAQRTARCVREFMGRWLEACGPQGHNFLTVLGAHEGEGLVLERDAAVAGSQSPLVSSKGQQLDIRIVEVALFFQKEIVRAAAAAAAGSETAGGPEQLVRSLMPVVLLSNDNAQIQLARSHGLPALRLAGCTELDMSLSKLGTKGVSLSSSLLRALLAADALSGLGSTAGRSLQQEFDGAVACLRAMAAACSSSAALLQRVREVAEGGGGDALGQIVSLLGGETHGGMFGGEEVDVVGLLRGGAEAVEGRLEAWEGLVRSHQVPSRVLKWALE